MGAPWSVELRLLAERCMVRAGPGQGYWKYDGHIKLRSYECCRHISPKTRKLGIWKSPPALWGSAIAHHPSHLTTFHSSIVPPRSFGSGMSLAPSCTTPGHRLSVTGSLGLELDLRLP
ncbi:hypothetical protein HYQ46_003410 [Verticillium longisporum]|nr:hypothetical protein HYQ46_003410 [Verticillium longisporum]